MFSEKQRDQLRKWKLSDDAIRDLERALFFTWLGIEPHIRMADVRKLLGNLKKHLKPVLAVVQKLAEHRDPLEKMAFYRLKFGIAMAHSAPGSRPDFRALDVAAGWVDRDLVTRLLFLDKGLDHALKGSWKQARRPKYTLPDETGRRHAVVAPYAVQIIANVLERHGIGATRKGRFAKIVGMSFEVCGLPKKADTDIRAHLKLKASK